MLLLPTTALLSACGDDGQPVADQRPDRRLTDARPHTEPVVDAYVPPDGALIDSVGPDAGVVDAAVEVGAGG